VVIKSTHFLMNFHSSSVHDESFYFSLYSSWELYIYIPQNLWQSLLIGNHQSRYKNKTVLHELVSAHGLDCSTNYKDIIVEKEVRVFRHRSTHSVLKYKNMQEYKIYPQI
jgi:hypothetical protein